MTAQYISISAQRPNTESGGFDLTIQPEAWTREAVCAEMPGDLFFPEAKGERVPNEVVAVCGRCPVAGACLEFALRTKQAHGFWGGQSPRQLKRLRIAAGRS